MLVPDVTTGAAPDLEDLRAACSAAIERIALPGRQIVVLGAGPQSLSHSPLARGTLAGHGVPVQANLGSPACGGAVELPLSLTVGAWLLGRVVGPDSGAVGFSVGPDFRASAAAVDLLRSAEEHDVALLVMGDGSARRSLAAPGYLDERAESFDAQVAAALRTGNAAALESLDADLGGALLAAGVPAWRVAGGLLDGGSYDSELLYDGAPYGVGYLVAAWTSR